jgi:hypothetical protein
MAGTGGPTVYRRLWWATVLAVSLPAVALGLAVAPVPALVVAASVVVLGLGLALVGAEPPRRSWLEAVGGATLVLAGVPALGYFTLPLMLLALGTSVCTVQHFLPGAFAGNGAGRVEEPVAADADVESCWDVMTGAELCELWSLSFALVKSTTDVFQRAVGAGLRCSVLDELERRDRRLLAAWLARHPSPASGPTWAVATKPNLPR